MNRRDSLKVLASGAVVWLVPSSRSSGQEIVLIPPSYLAEKYVAPRNSPSKGVIAGARERGDRFIVRGQVRDRSRPIAGASIYAFHADSEGFYTRDGLNSDENARLFGTFRTDSDGYYEYETIRPGAYDDLSAHFHHVVRADGYKPRLFDLWLGDDPILAANRLTGRNVPPEIFVRPVSRVDGIWRARHDIPMLRE